MVNPRFHIAASVTSLILLVLSGAVFATDYAVSGGLVGPLGGDSLGRPEGAAYIRCYNYTNDAKAQMFLDIGSVPSAAVDKIWIQNRKDVGSQLVMQKADIYVSSLEGGGSFNPRTRSQYDTLVYSGYLNPDSTAVGTWRLFDLATKVQKRYFAIDITQNALSPYNFDNQRSSHDTVDIGDVNWAPVAATPAGVKSDLWTATDALGRALPDYSQVGPVVPGRYVGMYSSLWLGQHGTWGPYDVSKILAANPTNPAWGPYDQMHFWGEPELGYYLITDDYVIRKHAQMLADAGVDVMIFDTSNISTYTDVYINVCRIFEDIRAHGGKTPQIAFFDDWGAGSQTVEIKLQELYDNLYGPGLFQDLWFNWNGKPLVMAPEEQVTSPTLRNFFTFRPTVGVTSDGSGFRFVDIWPQPYGWTGNPGVVESVCVSVAENMHGTNPQTCINVPMNSWTSFVTPNGYALHGRSWHNNVEDTTPGAVNWGYGFQEQWDRALTGIPQQYGQTPSFILVNRWDEWTAQRLASWNNWSGDLFVDTYNQECSMDIEPMRGGHGDNYYYQLVSNIRKYKGVSAPEQKSAATTIPMNGDFSLWDPIVPEYLDNQGDTATRDYDGFGSLHYTDYTGRNDIVRSKVTYDDTNVYFYAETAGNLTSYANPNWMVLYINSDNNGATGWHGYDYVVNYPPVNSTTTTLKKCVNGHLNWVTVRSDIQYRVVGNKIEISVPRASLSVWASQLSSGTRNQYSTMGSTIEGTTPRRGLSTPPTFEFHWSDNAEPLYSWDFNVNGDLEGWTQANPLSLYAQVSGGSMSLLLRGPRVRSTYRDSVYYTRSLAMDTATHKSIKISMRNRTTGTVAKLYWTTRTNSAWSETRCLKFNIIANDVSLKEYVLDLSNIIGWTGIVNGLAINPVETASRGQVDIGLIELGPDDFLNQGDNAPNRRFNYKF